MLKRLAEHGPFDVFHVGAEVNHVNDIHKSLLD